MTKCEICNKIIDEVHELGLHGEDDFYIFELCEECYEFYSSDTYTADDVLEHMNTTNYIHLDFLKDGLRLTGKDLGLLVYYHICDHIDYDKNNILVFPKNTEDISISFVKGFIHKLKINKDEFRNYFTIKTNDKVVNKFYKSINY